MKSARICSRSWFSKAVPLTLMGVAFAAPA